LCFFGVTTGALLMLGFVGGQESPFRGQVKTEKVPTAEKDKNGKDAVDPEAKAIYKTAERAVKGGGETEREKWLDELKSAFRGQQVSPGLTRDDFLQWYGLLAGDAPAWRRDTAPKKDIAELFDRTAVRLGLGEATAIRRDDFLAYAQRFLGPNNSPPWKDPLAGADKLFRDLDRNETGYLESAEWTDSLRAVARQTDANRDGRIDRGEYRWYFENRVVATIETVPPPEPKRNEQFPPQNFQRPKEPAQDAKPVAVRYGKLPPGLPKWFEEFDGDRDGQIALHEWRKAGRPLSEFGSMDLNDDSLLTADEWLRYDREQKRATAAEMPEEKPTKPMKKK
jgi:hypothetical protein